MTMCLCLKDGSYSYLFHLSLFHLVGYIFACMSMHNSLILLIVSLGSVLLKIVSR